MIRHVDRRHIFLGLGPESDGIRRLGAFLDFDLEDVEESVAWFVAGRLWPVGPVLVGSHIGVRHLIRAGLDP